jgi:hypothetical protein
MASSCWRVSQCEGLEGTLAEHNKYDAPAESS